MRITNEDVYNPHPVFGTQPSLFHGTEAPAATSQFTNKGTGTLYVRQIAAGHVQHWVKVKNDGTANDYACEWGCLSYTVARAAFTDGGSTSGTYDLPQQLPAGAKVKTISVTDITGFTGDTTAVLLIGVTGVDTDQFMTGTPTVFTTATWVDFGPPSGDAELEAATTVTLLITSTADFTNVAAGSVTVRVPYAL